MEFAKSSRVSEELLLAWHSHRLELILLAGLVAIAVKFGLYWRQKQSEVRLIKPVTVRKQEQDTAVHEVPSEHPTNVNLRPRQSQKKEPRRVLGAKPIKTRTDTGRSIDQIQPYVFYFTLGGSTKVYAERVAQALGKVPRNEGILQPIVLDLAEIDYDDFFITSPKAMAQRIANFYTILVPSYNIDTELSNFLQHMNETHHDFRIDTAPLSTLAGYSVFGFGDRQEWPSEREGYCEQAIEVDKWMSRLTGGKRAFPLGMGDVKSDAEEQLKDWQNGVATIIQDLSLGKGLGEGVVGSGDAVESDDEDKEDDAAVQTRRKLASAADLEDMRAPIPVDFTTTTPTATSTPKLMVPVNSPTYTSLTKQGYTIVGSHSGVKICRWTKSALRGRGSCYKFSFYGIASHRCMEATPSLSCSNKCVFCWRHGTNPVGTTWRWEVDPPELVFAGIKDGHYKKIKMLRAVPGVRAERYQEAMTIRHCALSLVGEPIFYPHINELLAMLHREHISSFLVCNAQHPDHLQALGPVTQLYVSIDASNKESLRRIDRPLHRDYWERFIRCMDILRAKRNTHRTVFRLTLVKGFNIEDEVAGYADLVERALPGFIEVKGVTYCGTSTAAGAGLTMQNVPFYEEVCAFVLALKAELKRRGFEYGIGAEHAHSCCILLADKTRFYKVGEDGQARWHTLIDYDKFFACLDSGKPFGPLDYVGEATPEWASWGRGGFDPRDVRVDRKGRPKIDVPRGVVSEVT